MKRDKIIGWRPDDWGEIKERECIICDPDETFFEAGADAMLEALKKSGVVMKNFNPTNRTVLETATFLNQCEDGILVFIPEE